MKDNKSGWQFPKALEIIKCKEGNKEFMKERPARRPFGNTVLICEYPIDDTAAENPNARCSAQSKKPEGIAAELADVIIRVLDYCAYAGIDIENVLEVKHEYNKSRPYRHGGKKC